MTTLKTLLAGAAALTGASFLASAALAGTNLISDGEFTSPSISQAYVTYSGGQTIGAWTVTGDSVDQIFSYWQSPTNGGDSIDLDGNEPGGLSQGVTLGGGRYLLSFYISGNPDGGTPLKTVDISVGGFNTTATYTTGGNSRGNMDWTLVTIPFTAPAGSTNLVLNSGDASGPFGAAIGDVSLTAVPEPATWAMLMLGVGALGVSLRKSRRSAAGLVHA